MNFALEVTTDYEYSLSLLLWVKMSSTKLFMFSVQIIRLDEIYLIFLPYQPCIL